MKFIIEQSAYSGVLKIAGKVAHDMELVTGTLPEIRVVETIDHEEVRSSATRELTIIVATMEHSRWLDAQKNIPTEALKGKRECYGWVFPDETLRERLDETCRIITLRKEQGEWKLSSSRASTY